MVMDKNGWPLFLGAPVANHLMPYGKMIGYISKMEPLTFTSFHGGSQISIEDSELLQRI